MSKQQAMMAVSTTEVVYVAAATAAKEAVWLRRLLGELDTDSKALTLKCDSQGAVAMTENPVSSARTKHIDVAHLFVRERAKAGEQTVDLVRTGEKVADCLTKPLPGEAFEKSVNEMGMRRHAKYSAAARVGVLENAGTRLDSGPVPSS